MGLILTVKNPLYPSAKRLKLYAGVGTFLVILMVVLSTVLNTIGLTQVFEIYTDFCVFKYRKKVNQIFQCFLIYPLVVSPIVGIYAIYISIYTLYKPGIGQNIRNKVIKK